MNAKHEPELLVGERLAIIETKIDTLVSRRDDHETRIRRLERWAWLVSGAAGAVGGTIASQIPGIGG